MKYVLENKVKKLEDQLVHILELIDFYENLNISNAEEEKDFLTFLTSLRKEEKRLQSKIDGLKNFLESPYFQKNDCVVDFKLKAILDKIDAKLISLNHCEKNFVEQQSLCDTTKHLDKNIVGSTSMFVENKRQHCKLAKRQKLEKFKGAILEQQPLTSEEKCEFEQLLKNSLLMTFLTNEEYDLCNEKLKKVVIKDKAEDDKTF